MTIVTHEGDGKTHISQRPLKTRDLDIFIRDSRAISILDKVLPQEQRLDTFDNHISAAKAFGFRTFFINDSKFRTKPVGLKNPVKCYGRSGKEGYVDYSEIATHKEWVKLWKVYVPESNNIGTELNDDNQNAFVGAPNTVCTETFLVVGADLNLDENKATNLCKILVESCQNQSARHGKNLSFCPRARLFTGLDGCRSVHQIQPRRIRNRLHRINDQTYGVKNEC